MGLFLELFASFFDSFLCVLFICRFVHIPEKSQKRNWINILAILVIFGVTVLGDYCAETFSTLFSILIFLTSLIFAILICRKKYIRAIVAASIFEVLVVLLSSMLFYICSYVFDSFEELLYGEDNFGRFAYIISHKIILMASVHLILTLTRKNDRMHIRSGILSFLFSLVTVGGLGYAMSISLDASKKEMRLPLFLISVAFFMLNIALYLLIERNSQLEHNNFELKLSKAKAEFEERRYGDALALWNDSQKIRHDVKHHLVALNGMLENNDLEGMRKYLDEYAQQIQKNERFLPSGNAVIDYLIASKLSPLTDTTIVVAGNCIDYDDIQETDLASLIGNILDNAVEAESGLAEKRIELLFTRQNNNRMLICKNNIGASVLEGGRKLKTTKCGNGHGFGHLIVEEIAAKYNGFISYFEEGNMFGIQVILPIL